MFDVEEDMNLLESLGKADLNVFERARMTARTAMRVAAVLKESRGVDFVLAGVCGSLEDIGMFLIALRAILILFLKQLQGLPN